MTARASDSMFYPLTMCALQIVFMIMIMIMLISGRQAGHRKFHRLFALVPPRRNRISDWINGANNWLIGLSIHTWYRGTSFHGKSVVKPGQIVGERGRTAFPFHFLAAESSLHDDSYIQHKQQKKCALNA